MRRLGAVLASSVLLSSLAAAVATAEPATAGRTPTPPGPDDVRLAARAVLPADTFVPGSAPSGAFTGNPAAPFPGQPVQGFSAVHRLPNGSYLAMSDNGFGAKANSADFLLRVHRIAPRPRRGTIDVRGGFYLSDPFGRFPFTTWRDGGCQVAEAAGTLPAGYRCPPRDRLLTGWDLDLESMQVDPDGSLWFGEEFGPFVLHTDRRGRLLEAPLPTPGVRSPSSPALLPGQQPTLADSKGFEGMAISPDGTRLYPMLEGATADDQAAGLASDRRIYEVRVGDGRRPTRFTGAFDRYRMEAPANAVGDFIAVNRHEYLVIERDNNSGAAAALKRIYLVDTRDRDRDGYVDKTLLVDLLAVPDPDDVGGLGDPFTFPYVTIEDVELVDADTIAVLNDNNYPGTGGRGPDVRDVNEYLEIDLAEPLDVDPRLLAR